MMFWELGMWIYNFQMEEFKAYLMFFILHQSRRISYQLIILLTIITASNLSLKDARFATSTLERQLPSLQVKIIKDCIDFMATLYHPQLRSTQSRLNSRPSSIFGTKG